MLANVFEEPIKLQNSLLYSRVEEVQRTHSGDENGYIPLRGLCAFTTQ